MQQLAVEMQEGGGWCFTLFQVLLVVPRLFLFGNEFLHCPWAQHGKAEKQAAMWEQWSSGGLAPPAGKRRFFKAELQRGCVRSGRTVLWIDVFPFCVHSHHTSHTPTSQHGPIPVLWPAAASAAAAERRGSSGVAIAALPISSSVGSRCIHGMLRNGSTSSNPTTFGFTGTVPK